MKPKITSIIMITIVSMGFINFHGIDSAFSKQRQVVHSFFNFGLKFAKHALKSSTESNCYSPIGSALLMASLASGASNTTEQELYNALGLNGFTPSEIRDYVFKTINYLEHFQGHSTIGSFLASEDGPEEANDFFKSFPVESAFDMHHLLYEEIPDHKYFCPLVDDNKSFIAFVEHAMRNITFMHAFTTVLEEAIVPNANDWVLRGEMLIQLNTFRHGENQLIDAQWIELPLKNDLVHTSLSMIIIVPNQKDGFNKILDNFDRFANFFDDAKTDQLEVWLPRFEFIAKHNCIADDVWNKVGLKDMFGDKADFIEIFGSKPTPLRFGGSTHVAHLQFDLQLASNLAQDSNTPYLLSPIDLSFKPIEIFKVDKSFVGVIVSQSMMHFAFQVIMPEENSSS